MTASSGHVFVSHSSENRGLAAELAAFLEARGARVWIAPRDVRPGMDYSEELQTAIETCSAFVVLVTDMANKSPYVRAETEMAFSNHKPIFPVRISDIKPAAGLALFLKIRHWTDAYGPTKTDNLARLVRELQALSGPEATAPPAEPPTTTPPQDPAGNRTTPPPPPPPPPAPPPPEPLSAADEEKWRAAVGRNAEWYLGRWRQMAEKRSAISWNWAACLASAFWMAWRKMWLPMAAVIGAVALLAAIGATSPAMAQATMLLNVGISFVTGAFGNHLYRRQTAKLVADTEPLGREAQLEALRSRGGTSTPALIVSLVVVGLVALLLVLAAIGTVLKQQQELNVVGGGEISGEVVDDPDAPPAEGEVGGSGEIGGTVDTGKPEGDGSQP